MSHGAVRVVLGVVLGVLLLGGALGCSGKPEAADASGVPAASGVVLDGPEGDPRPGVRVELLVHPAALGAAGGQAVKLDEGAADDRGRFVLNATPDELTPYAGSDGRVQIEVKVAGESSAVRTTLLVQKEPGTGIAQVVESSEITLAAPGE